jgi:hypothetical protein
MVGGKSPLNVVPLDPPAFIPQSGEIDDKDGALVRSETFGGCSFVKVKAPWSRSSVMHKPAVVQSVAQSNPSSISASSSSAERESKTTDLNEKEMAAAPSVTKRRWADLSDDEQSTTGRTYQNSENGESPRCQSNEENLESEAVNVATPEPHQSRQAGGTPVQGVAPKRPQFARPTRESRSRQLHVKIDECFDLDFDGVDPSQQDGLTHRMLVTLKSLGELVTFWNTDGEQLSEEGFHIVGLQEEDMYSLGRIVRKADKLLDKRQFRDAYDSLCKARRWFDPETLVEERTKAKDRKSCKKDGRRLEGKSCKSDEALKVQEDDAIDGWSEVLQRKSKKPISSAKNPEQLRKGSQVEFERKKKITAGTQNHAPRIRNTPQKTTTKPQKFLCRYLVGIEQDRSFNVVRKLLGDHGAHMKVIAENTGAKLRIRGRGSGFKEGQDNVEADEPLMICISATASEGFGNATEDVESLLKHVHDQYYAFCNDRNLPCPRLVVSRTEQPHVTR